MRPDSAQPRAAAGSPASSPVTDTDIPGSPTAPMKSSGFQQMGSAIGGIIAGIENQVFGRPPAGSGAGPACHPQWWQGARRHRVPARLPRWHGRHRMRQQAWHQKVAVVPVPAGSCSWHRWLEPAGVPRIQPTLNHRYERSMLTSTTSRSSRRRLSSHRPSRRPVIHSPSCGWSISWRGSERGAARAHPGHRRPTERRLCRLVVLAGRGHRRHRPAAGQLAGPTSAARRASRSSDGAAGPELVIEDTPRVGPWLVRQVTRLSAACTERLRVFAVEEGAIP